MPSTCLTRRATKKTANGIPGTATSNDETSTPNNGNTVSPNKRPSTKQPGAEVKKGLDPLADNEEVDGHRGKARQAPKADVKEQIKAEREAGVKALKEKIEAVQMAKEHLAQMNIMEEREEDDLLSTTIHKQRHVDIETDSDECFNLKDVDHGPDEDSSSESDEATKTKTKGKKCVKGAARQELLTRTEELCSVEHSQGRQKVKRDIGGFAAQDLHCKKYANSGLRLRSLTPANTAQLQQPEVADLDPFELGSLCDDDLEETCPVVAEVKGLQYNLSCGNELVRVRTKTEDIDLGTKPQATCKAPESKATKATVKKGASFKSLESPKPFVGLGACPDIAQQCLDDPRWKRVFLPTLSHALYITDHPFTDWTWESNTLLQTIQNVFNISFPNISYTLSGQDKVVRAAYDRTKTRRSKIASDVLLLVKTFFEGTEFRNRPERIKEHKPDGFLRSQFILPVAKTYASFAEKSVLHPSLGPRNPPKGLYAMVLTAVERAMRAHMTGAFHAPGEFNHQITWNSMKDFYKILDQVRESHWAQALNFDDFDDTESGADESFLSACRVDFYLPSSPTKSGA
ncbi:hypothetical protein EDB86DRAFT_3080297 [Lactarius hatsudake]|nr:hypothetical protein EDB86DRAFT_3080297 [Lactarius hatsudake]